MERIDISGQNFMNYYKTLTNIKCDFADISVIPVFNLTGLFANLKRLGEGQNSSPPNLAISGQIMMKLGKDIPWVEIFTI